MNYIFDNSSLYDYFWGVLNSVFLLSFRGWGGNAVLNTVFAMPRSSYQFSKFESSASISIIWTWWANELHSKIVAAVQNHLTTDTCEATTVRSFVENSSSSSAPHAMHSIMLGSGVVSWLRPAVKKWSTLLPVKKWAFRIKNLVRWHLSRHLLARGSRRCFHSRCAHRRRKNRPH